MSCNVHNYTRMVIQEINFSVQVLKKTFVYKICSCTNYLEQLKTICIFFHIQFFECGMECQDLRESNEC